MMVSGDRWRHALTALRAVVIRRGVRGADVDDVVQRALEKSLMNLERLSDTDRFEPWVKMIAANEAVDHLRARARAPLQADVDEADTIASEQEDFDPLLSYADCINPFLARISEAEREALTLKDLEGRTFREIAEMLAISVPGAKSRVQRARKNLARALAMCCEALTSTPVADMQAGDCSDGCCQVDSATAQSSDQASGRAPDQATDQKS